MLLLIPFATNSRKYFEGAMILVWRIKDQVKMKLFNISKNYFYILNENPKSLEAK